MKNKLLTLALFGFAITANAQEKTDVTSTYLQNPSFEEGIVTGNLTYDSTRGAYEVSSLSGWQLTANLSSGFGVTDIMTADATATDNDFGAPGSPSDGTYMLYLRDAWNATSATLTQSITLPAGDYELTLDYKCVSGSSHTASLTAGSSRTSLTFQSSMPSSWNTASLVVSLSKETTIDVGLSVSFVNASGGSVLVDNFRLYSYPEGYEEPAETDVESPTEGVITQDFVSEEDMMDDLLGMIARFSKYMVNDFYDCQAPNNINEECGYFNGESSGASNEAGVRTNADLSMLCAFLVKYAQPKGVALPTGGTWDRV